MLVFTLLVSVAVALESGLSSTSDQTITETLSLVPVQASSSSSSPSTSSISTETETLSLALASSTASGAASSLAITSSASLPTPSCNSNYGRNCDRLPEQPYYVYVDPSDLTNSYYGFTDINFQDPWSGFTRTQSASSAAISSALSCGLIFSSSLDEYFSSAPLTAVTYVPPSTITTTATPFSETFTDDIATATVTSVETYTYGSGAAITTTTVTDTDVPLIATITSTTRQTGGTETIEYAGYTAFFYQSDFSFKPTSSCCSSCTIYAGNVEVLYFSTPAPTATATANATRATTVVNSDGFIFTSPSVYLALQSLQATNLCGPVGSDITSATTIGFAPGALSTTIAYSQNSSAYTWYPGWVPSSYEAATFGTAVCTDIVTTFYLSNIGDQTPQTQSVETNTYTVADETGTGSSIAYVTETLQPYTLTYNPCFPYLSIPPQVSSIDPLWSTCKSYLRFALFDPPSVLSPVTGLGGGSPVTTSSQAVTTPQGVTTSSPAAPSSTHSSVVPPVTTTSTPPAPPPTSIDPTTATSTTPVVKPTSTSPAVAPVSSSPTPSDPAGPPGSSSTPADPVSVTESTSPVVGDPGTQSTSSSPIAANPPTPTTSTSPAAVNPPAPTISSPFVATIGGTTVTANSNSGFIIGTQTLSPGSQITVSGTTLSLASNGATLVAGTSTQALITPPAVAPTYVIGSQTLSAGAPGITVSGTVFSLQSGGSSVVVGGSTQPISALLGSSTPEYVVGSQTLVAGGSAITISGTVVSLQSGGSSVVVGRSTTEPLSALLGSTTTTATGTGLAGIVASIGGFETSSGKSSSTPVQYTGTAGSNATQFTGAGGRSREVGSELSVWTWGVGVMIGIVVAGWL